LLLQNTSTGDLGIAEYFTTKTTNEYNMRHIAVSHMAMRK